MVLWSPAVRVRQSEDRTHPEEIRGDERMTATRTTGASDARRRESNRWLVLLAPIALIATTYPVFRLADAVFEDALGGRLAWFIGMSVYWVAWGWIVPTWVLGRRQAWELIRPRRPSPLPVAHVSIVIALAATVRFLVPGMAYEKATTGAVVLLAISPFANGLFEELLWRGVFLVTYPHSTWLRVIWPSMMFGLWHLVPGSISPEGPHIAMVIGPFLMGVYLAWLSKKTGTIWWATLAHTFGGLVMIS